MIILNIFATKQPLRASRDLFVETTRRWLIKWELLVTIKTIRRCSQKTRSHKECPKASTNHILISWMNSWIVNHASTLHIHTISWIQKMTSIVHNLTYKSVLHMMTLTSMNNKWL
jgi:hypothetical protein